MKKNVNIIIIAAIAACLTACNFLDKNPDERADIDSQKKVQLLLVSGYDYPNYGPIGEVSSDNMVDNNTPDAVGHINKKVALSQMYDQIFAWEDVTSDNQQDTPYAIWQNLYKNIAVANQALAAIDKLEAKGEHLDAERSEALLIRAYNHFLLVNIFCQAYRNDELSQNDLGIHYMTEAETTVKPQYDRSNVAEVYRRIGEDLKKGLEHVSDDYYSVPKYHFNSKAAYAFAAKYYLYTRQYDQVIECANKVLGTSATDAQNMMFDAAAAKAMGNGEKEMYAWMDAQSPSNLMIISTMSQSQYAYLTSYARYTFNRAPKDATIMGPGPCWDNRFPGTTVWQYNQNFGGFLAKLIEVFEYTDKVAGIGYLHALRRELTAGETLLCRAEAEIMKGQIAAAVSDMDVWCKGYCCTKALTEANIQSFFRKGRSTQLTPTLHNSDMSEDWIIDANKLPFIWCVLHFRRIETLHDGMRWFDIKRYGIELEHVIGNEQKVVTLLWNDARRAIQLPQEAILAGQTANPRPIVGHAADLTAPSTARSDYEMYLWHKTEQPTLIPFDEQ